VISKYMKKIVDQLVKRDFQFIDATGKTGLKVLERYVKKALKKDEDYPAVRVSVLAKVPGGDKEAGLYFRPDAEVVVGVGDFEAIKKYDAYGTCDIKIDGKTVRLLNNYGDEDGNDGRVNNANCAWFSPCIMYESRGKIVFELVDLVLPVAEFGRHKPFIYRHAKAKTNIPASCANNIGFGKRAFFYGKNWLLSNDSKEDVFSIKQFLNASELEALGLGVTKKTQHLKLGGFNLCVSDNMIVIPVTEVQVHGHK